MGLLSHDQIQNSPSRAQMTELEEKLIRCKVVKAIMRAGMLLQLPIETISTAANFFQQFYSIHFSLKECEPYLVAKASLFLASKVGENDRRIRDVLNCVYRVRYPDREPLEVAPEFWAMKDDIVRCEQLVLRVLGFDMDVDLAHSYVLHIARDLEASQELATTAFHITNDSLCTTLGLQYRAPSIACGAIYLAGEMLSQQIKGSTHTHTRGEEWWCTYGANRIELEDICHQLLALYEMNDPDEPPSSTSLRPVSGNLRNVKSKQLSSSTSRHLIPSHAGDRSASISPRITGNDAKSTNSNSQASRMLFSSSILSPRVPLPGTSSSSLSSLSSSSPLSSSSLSSSSSSSSSLSSTAVPPSLSSCQPIASASTRGSSGSGGSIGQNA